MLKKIILYIIFLIFLSTPVHANPIPVFQLAGWLDNDNFTSDISRIIEREYSSEQGLKLYDLYPNRIIEREYSSEQGLKLYDLYPNRIIEREYSSEQGLKLYDLY